MNPFDHQRRHPTLTVTLFIAMLAPGPFLVVIAVAEQSQGDETIEAFKGLGSRSPVLGMCMAIFLFSLMIAGATAWLLVAAHLAERKVIEPFFIYPGVPFFSALAAKMFAWAYRPPADHQR